MKTVLILTGPQGSGNHVWSKIFAMHPRVYGWQALLEQYWIGHDKEPFADCWENPSLLSQFPWSRADWFVTSMSVPYMLNGESTVVDFKGFVRGIQAQGHRVKFAILGRDKNIVDLQQQRVRGGVTLPQALTEFEQLASPVFLSYELLQLYGSKYLESVSQQLGFPIDYQNPMLKEILKEDTNSKYFKPVPSQATDALVHATSAKWR